MITEQQKQAFLKRNTFYCKNFNARISKRACSLNQDKPYTRKSIFGIDIGFEKEYCGTCKQGKRRYKSTRKDDRKPRQKECFIHQHKPALCKNKGNKGIFIENLSRPPAEFTKKKYCCIECAYKSHYKYFLDLVNRKERE